MVERRTASSPLLYWATERENIRLKKLEGYPPPWTGDPILQKYRFCNVNRRHDRVSQWLLWNVLNHCDYFDNVMVFVKWVALCRWVNWPPTLSDIILADGDLITNKNIRLKKIGVLIDKKCGDSKAWTGAYMIRAPSKKKYPGITKGAFVAETVVGGLDAVSAQLRAALKQNSAQAVWELLCSVPNWGTFMAGQVVADLTYTPLLEAAGDLNTWAPQGPGSRRGFNRLMGRPLYDRIQAEEWSDRLQDWRGQVAAAIGSELNLMDLQNCLCETDKYLRVKAGEGRPRSTYKPETAF
jgi:hypothetical protein